jgi:hypothetical protein
MRALPTNGEATTMAQASVRADVHQAFDVHLYALAQVAFDFALRVKNRANATEFVLAQISDACINADLRLRQDRGRTRAPDTVNVCETDLRALIRRKIDTSYTSHNFTIADCRLLIADLRKTLVFQSEIRNPKSEILSSLSLFMLGVGADHAHHAFAVNDLAVVAHLFN